ncbi:hypothetical protein ACFLXJ_02595 [Chloroflexota bacterium]
MELDEGEVIVEEDAKIEFHDCRVSNAVLETLESTKLVGANIVLDNVVAVQSKKSRTVQLSNGRRFLNKLISLARRAGRKQFTVYEYKLRDCTPGTDEQFSVCVDLLEKVGCVKKHLTWIVLTDLATENMYTYRAGEEQLNDERKRFWDPIVAELDKILSK